VTTTRTPRTGRLLRRAESTATIRLTRSDRAFLADLSKVGVVAEADASAHHYQERKTPARRRLDALADAGILRIDEARDRDNKPIRVYTWGSDSVARAYGSRQLQHSATRSLYHELLVSRSYYAAGRPEDFRIATQFNDADRRLLPDRGESAALLPDAMFTDADGSTVVVEADAGHYSSTQIREKMAAWQGCRQLWAQPARATARVPAAPNSTVLTF
jgi:hypothetical protein